MDCPVLYALIIFFNNASVSTKANIHHEIPQRIAQWSLYLNTKARKQEGASTCSLSHSDANEKAALRPRHVQYTQCKRLPTAEYVHDQY